MSHAATFEAIRSLIRAEKLALCTDATLRIEEHGKHATLKLVKIVSIGASAFSIKLDECGFPGNAVFNTHNSLHRACDAVAFCEVKSKPYILCCELKSSEPTRRDVTEQFKSAHCFLEYLNTLLQEYCECEPISLWPRRYFVFHGGDAMPLAKEPSRKVVDNTRPEAALFIPVENGKKQ